MKDLAIFALLLFVSAVQITDWISSWAATMVSLDLTANAASALLMQSVMNFMHSNAQLFYDDRVPTLNSMIHHALNVPH